MAKQKDSEHVMDNPTEQTEDMEQEVAEAAVGEETVEGEPAQVESELTSDGVAAGEETEAEEVPLSVEEQLELARQEAAENKENWQRAVAELVNYKRRQEEQRKLLRDRIKSEVLEGVISALDDMDLAFQNVPEELDGQVLGWVEGFRLVNRKLDKILDDQNVMPINTEGEFDPNLHEAVSYEESEDHTEGEIIGELRKGYQIGNRVIRPALVRVAK